MFLRIYNEGCGIMDFVEELKYLNEFKNKNYLHFDDFYEEFKNKIFYNILAVIPNTDMAEEILQDTFVTFLENIDNINDNVSSLGYLMKISRNKAITFYRKKKKEIYLDQYDNEGMYGSVSLTWNYATELINKIKKILNHKEYEVFMLKVMNEHSHQEIANLLHRPLGTILWTYNNAIKKLQKGIGEEYV